MHLLVAAHDLYPDRGSGGTGRYVYETGRRLVDRGHHVSVVTRRRGPDPRHDRVEGVRVYRYDLDVAGEAGTAIARQLPTAARTVSRLVESAGDDDSPDVVSFQGPITSLLVDRAVPGWVPRTCTFHSPWPAEYRIRARAAGRWRPRRRLNVALRRWLEGRLVSRADHLLALSEFMRGELDRLYGPDAAVSVVPGGVDTDRFRPDAGRLDGLDGPGTEFLTVRRLSPRMGHGMLLSAFAGVAADRPGAHLHVAGDGSLRAALERRTRSLEIDDRVTFRGHVPDAELPALYASADCFVLPTTELEGFGLATLEALASGTPVVGTPVGGTVELLGPLADRPGVPVRPLAASASADALAARMAAWADLDAGALAEARRACRAYAEGFDWERPVDRLETRYAGLCGRADGPAGPAEPTRRAFETGGRDPW